MSFVNRRLEEDMYDGQMQAIAQYVIEGELVDGAALGISKQVLDKGYASLTEKQADIFQRFAVPKADVACGRCGNPIPAEELGPGGVCGYCAHMMDKDD